MGGNVMESVLAGVANNFHFVRPEWLYALVPVAVIFIILKMRESRGSNWEDTIDPNLLPFLLDNTNARATRSPMSLLLIAWIIATIALAGPAWRKLPQPVHERKDALMVILDLSRSMYATDVKPDRFTRAKRKLLDLFDSRKEGVTGLIVYAGDAHTVAPLTDDTNTIAAMLQALGPDIMPAGGSRLTPALKLAEQRFHDAGATTGRILLITDEIRDRASALEVTRKLRSDFPVSVMAVGTPEGAPIPSGSGPRARYLKDSAGNLVIPGVDLQSLRDFASVAGGRYSRMTLTDDDLDYLLDEKLLPTDDEFREVERDFDVWIEEGPWLILLLLPLAALAFRRGWLWSLALMVSLHSEPAAAFSWQDLWKTPGQQGLEALKAGDPETAAEKFEDRAWKGTARYRAEDYEGAARAFADIESSDGKYNYGNALAKQRHFKQAIEAYEEALAVNPDNEDAAHNKRLIEELLKQQQQRQQNNQNQQGEDQNRQQQSQQDQSGQDERDKQQEQQDQHQAQQDQEQNQQDQTARQQKQQKEEQDAEQARQQQLTERDADPLEDEERQALEQWLRRVPDDPGGLLRRKFRKQYEERLRQGKITNDDSRDW